MESIQVKTKANCEKRRSEDKSRKKNDLGAFMISNSNN